jgi:outer membrane protein assembly factor BamB
LFREDGTCLMMEYQEKGGSQRMMTVDVKTGKTLKSVDFPAETGMLRAASGDVLVLQRLRKSEMVRQGDVGYRVALTEEDKKEKITAYDEKAGKEQWTVAIPRDRPTQDELILAGDVLLQGDPGTMWYRTPSLSESWTLTALDMADGKALWKRERMAGTPVVHGETVILSGANFLEAVDRREGKARWRIPTAGAPSVPVIVEGVVYFGVRGNGQSGPGRYDGICGVALEGK